MIEAKRICKLRIVRRVDDLLLDEVVVEDAELERVDGLARVHVDAQRTLRVRARTNVLLLQLHQRILNFNKQVIWLS